MLDLRRHPAGLRNRHWRDALPWLVTGALPVMLLLGAGVQALPEAADWQDRWQAHEAQRLQWQSAQAQARAEQARQASAARHAQQWQAWAARQVWLAQLRQGLSQWPADVRLQQLQLDDTRVQLQLSAAHESALQAVLQGLQAAGTGPWQLRQQSVAQTPAAHALPTAGTGQGTAPGRWLFVLQADVPALGVHPSDAQLDHPQALAPAAVSDPALALARSPTAVPAGTPGVP